MATILRPLAKASPFHKILRQYASPVSWVSPRRAVNPVRMMADEAPVRKRYIEYEYEEEPDDFRDFQFDDISSVAHSELELHREARQYNRVAAYEMPRLSQLAKPFEPPTGSQVLRFRYTTYMGEEHPAESKVVLEFSPLDLHLTVQERSKLIKLAGVRYNPDTEVVKMSCEMFQHLAQNKRYLSDVLDKLIAAARDQTDTFEDVPFDFRHHMVQKPKPRFPHRWTQIALEKRDARMLKGDMHAAKYPDTTNTDSTEETAAFR